MCLYSLPAVPCKEDEPDLDGIPVSNMWPRRSLVESQKMHLLLCDNYLLVTQHLLSSKFGSFRKWQSCRLGRKVYSALL